jgi:isopenicillin N synthase-like dioxygenase
MLDTLAEIPALSLADQQSDPDGFAQKFGRSFQRFGFAWSRSRHPAGSDRARLGDDQGVLRLPEEEKRSYFVEGGGGARGYTPFKTEIAKGASHVDLKEFWHVGRELARGHRFAAAMPPISGPTGPRVSARPSSSCSRRSTMPATGCSRRSRAISGSRRTGSIHAVKDGNSVLRLLHYPPVPPTRPKSAPARMRTST